MTDDTDGPATWEEAVRFLTSTLSENTLPGFDNPDVPDLDLVSAIETYLGTPLMCDALTGAILHYGQGVRGEVLREIGEMVIRKHRDYGQDNILRYGLHGIEVRASDKLCRARNLLGHPERDPLFESLEDTFADLVGYGLVGLLLELGWFGLPMGEDTPT
jgi:hypothetical protein